jgi:hypothetical protein
MTLILRSILRNSAARPMAAKAYMHNAKVGMMGLAMRPFFATSHSSAIGSTIQYFSSTAIQGTVSDGVSSPSEIQQKTPGTVTKRLRVLDITTVQKIQEELRSVDANSDGVYVLDDTVSRCDTCQSFSSIIRLVTQNRFRRVEGTFAETQERLHR